MARAIWNQQGPLLNAIERRQDWGRKAHAFVGADDTDQCELCGQPPRNAVHTCAGAGLNHDTAAAVVELQLERLFDERTEWEANAGDALGIELARMRHPSEVARRREILRVHDADEAQRLSDAGVNYARDWVTEIEDRLEAAGYFDEAAS